MTIRGKVRDLAIKLGADLTISGERFITMDIDAPNGKVWKANQCHVLSCGSYHHLTDENYADAFERMSMGLDDCEDTDCEVCHPEKGE